MRVEYFQKMFHYNYWANDKVWECILALSEEQFRYPCDYSVGSIHEQIVHMMSAEELWLERIQASRNPNSLALADDYPTREAIADHWQTIRHDWIVYLDELTPEDLESEIAFVSVTYNKTFTNPRWEAILQVLNHSTDHRAQILSLIHQVGGNSTAQDFIFYTWEQ